MEKYNNIFDKFETKLRENIQIIKKQNEKLNETEDRLKDALKDRQTIQELYERGAEECIKLKDLLADIKCGKKIENEKQMICLNEENKLNLTKIERLSQQIIQIKHELNDTQSKCWASERKLVQTEGILHKNNTFRTAIESEISEIQNQFQSLREEFRLLSENQNEIKNDSCSAIDVNRELTTKVNKLNEELICVNEENSSHKTLVIELREKLRQKEDELNDKDLKLLRLTQTTDLQKQEINELVKHLEELIREKESLKTNAAKNNWDSSDSSEVESDKQMSGQTSPSTEDNPMVID